jgi:hypothetical protein
MTTAVTGAILGDIPWGRGAFNMAEKHRRAQDA